MENAWRAGTTSGDACGRPVQHGHSTRAIAVYPTSVPLMLINNFECKG